MRFCRKISDLCLTLLCTFIVEAALHDSRIAHYEAVVGNIMHNNGTGANNTPLADGHTGQGSHATEPRLPPVDVVSFEFNYAAIALQLLHVELTLVAHNDVAGGNRLHMRPVEAGNIFYTQRGKQAEGRRVWIVGIAFQPAGGDKAAQRPEDGIAIVDDIDQALACRPDIPLAHRHVTENGVEHAKRRHRLVGLTA